MESRRSFLQTAAALGVSLGGQSVVYKPEQNTPARVVKPARLKIGDTIGLVCPAAPAYSQETVQITIESLEAMGFKVKQGAHFYERYGYLAGRDEARAADLNAMFADKSVSAIMAMHGGWGCARILPLLDYNVIRSNPKVLIGYSDITALLLGIHAQTGLVTMHGPEGAATWNAFTVNYFKRLLMDAEEVFMSNPTDKTDSLTQTTDRITTWNGGTARGQLVGGNLTVLSHLVGSKYMPDTKGKILFLEDVDEEVYSMDRMLTHLKLAGILDGLAGFVFGKCTKCSNGGGGYGSLTLDDVFSDIIVPLQIPAFSGAMIGHISHKFTVPVGIEAEINANAGTLKLLEKAVL